MSLHPHQHRALVAELRRPEFAGLSADEAFEAFQPVKVRDEIAGTEVTRAAPALKALAGTWFLTEARLAKMERKPDRFAVVSDAEVAAFGDAGIPGFPNKLKRDWFDAAWREALAHG